MKRNKLILVVLFVSLFISTSFVNAWEIYTLPRVVVGGSYGVLRVSLDNFSKYYNSRWDGYYSGQISVRVYKNNYVTVQYGKYNKTGKSFVNNETELTTKAKWDERILNVGIRRYSELNRRWRSFIGIGFAFIDVEEAAGYSLFKSEAVDNVKTDGQGFFLEIGGDYFIIPNLAFSLEFEATTASEGGGPSFVGSNLGGYAFMTGVNLHF